MRRRQIASMMVVTAVVTAIATVALERDSASHGPAASALSPRAPRAARASLLGSARHAELVVSNMPEPPIGEIYELWLIRSGDVPAQPTDALFTVTSAGDGSVAVPGDVRGVREVMVTSEPLGGSSSPTSAAVLRVRVSLGR
jgi:Anti-sigma-K factor rskA